MRIIKFYHKTTFRLLKLLSVSISAILGVFCNFGGVLYGPAPKYGMLEAEYKISGTIRSVDQNIPVRGLSVSFADTMSSLENIDSARTDSLGKYSLEFSGPRLEQTGKLIVNDIDSSENGLFMEKDTIISLAEGNTIIDLKIDRNNQ